MSGEGNIGAKNEWTLNKAIWLVILAGVIAPLFFGLAIGVPLAAVMTGSAIFENEPITWQTLGPIFLFPYFALSLGLIPGFTMGLSLALWRRFKGKLTFPTFLKMISLIAISAVWLIVFIAMEDEQEIIGGLVMGTLWAAVGIAFACLFWSLRYRLGLGSLSHD